MSTLSTRELADALLRLYEETDEELREKYHRSLSFQDGLFNRWERAKRLGFGAEAQVYNSVQVFGDVNAGEHTFVGAFCVLDGGYAPVRIGRYVTVSAGVHIYSHDTMLWSLNGGKADKRIGPVNISDYCYIGSQALIGCGVNVGERSVIGANSFVNRDIPARSIFAGSPARQIGRVEERDGVARPVFFK
jgi:acetyltransferase-like isoleucine patch superfamily enzyme